MRHRIDSNHKSKLRPWFPSELNDFFQHSDKGSLRILYPERKLDADTGFTYIGNGIGHSVSTCNFRFSSFSKVWLAIRVIFASPRRCYSPRKAGANRSSPDQVRVGASINNNFQRAAMHSSSNKHQQKDNLHEEMYQPLPSRIAARKS